MSHFYGMLQGNRGEATRMGSKASGITTHTASWEGAIRVHAYHNEDTGEDMVLVKMVPWKGNGIYGKIFEGKIGGP